MLGLCCPACVAARSLPCAPPQPAGEVAEFNMVGMFGVSTHPPFPPAGRLVWCCSCGGFRTVWENELPPPPPKPEHAPWRFSLLQQGAKPGDVPVKEIVDAANRTAWIAQQVDLAKNQYMDGINIDIEQEIDEMSPEYYALTALVKETTDAFHSEIPGSQVTFDVAWSPACVDKRCYNYSGIADACDFLFVMSYDEQSQIWTDCIAGANAPYNQTLDGYDSYINMNIEPKKLVMGVPWYGYDYKCLNLSKELVCFLPNIPFRGAPCSDAAGSQVPYRVIMKQVNSSISGILWDEEQKAPYYDYKDPLGNYHQVWYDDPQSISLKALYAKKRGLRGIGMWNGNCLDYSRDPVAVQQTEAMWQALRP
ncbi:di-N-acetylchitobiase isoform X2 [Pelodiscus sinensis]|uniref:di-N-acetylchitobiase isoform X2 n=1 Tax=Pelodiscus sinensis TaxID=13735 RepID=UPI003F6B58DB